MKILHRFMLKQFLGPFVLIFFIVIFVLLMQFLWKYIDELVGKGLDLSIVAEFLLYSTANLTSMAFPLAILLASIFTLSSLGENYELIAFKAAGISLQRIVFPLIIFSVLVAGTAFLFTNNVTPVANLKMRTLLDGIRHQRPELQLREGVFSNMVDGYSIRIGDKDYKTNTLYDVRIYDHTEKIGNVNVIVADSGSMVVTADKRFLEITLFNGHRYNDEVTGKTIDQPKNNHPFSHQTFDKQIFRMELPSYDFERSDEQIFKKSYAMMNLEQLDYVIDSLITITEKEQQQIQLIIKPAFQQRALPAGTVIDTTLRAKIPDHFLPAFHDKPKARRLSDVQKAIAETRNHKDQFAGLIMEREAISHQMWRYDIEWHRKFSIAISCIVLFFIGAPLGAIIRKGGIGTPIIIAVLFFVLYYVISIIGEKSARGGSMNPMSGMWLSTAIVLPVSIFLTYMATRDSVIFNPEIYINFFTKGLGYVFATQHTPRTQTETEVPADELMPENMIASLGELSHRCRLYMNETLDRKLTAGKIWYKQKDENLERIGEMYDHIRAVLQKTDIEMLRESIAEYPVVTLYNPKIRISNTWLKWGIYVTQIWTYFYLKALVQKFTLRKELNHIMSANQNLMTELTSIL
ncbi:MAG: LptF/LptG family permease [Bacteroidales bacterium]|jgi:lipopolysaccharide export system permease protein|nr:LptF/LptG family permease [Bacteroidales bacterium]